jgi:hypothetical protein
MLALQGYNLAKVVQSKDSWLTSVPGKPDFSFWGGIDMLDNVLLQDVVGHAKRLALWIEMFLVQVVTVVAVQVADGANRFGKNLKFVGSLDHFLILRLN